MTNQPQLSAREQQIANMIAAGLTDMQIAAKIGVSWYTVRSHVRNIHNKLGTGRRIVLALEYSRCCTPSK